MERVREFQVAWTRSKNRRRVFKLISQLADARDDLGVRLGKGWDLIESGRSDLEEYWFDMLGAYETVCDVLDQINNPNLVEQAAIAIFDAEVVPDG